MATKRAVTKTSQFEGEKSESGAAGKTSYLFSYKSWAAVYVLGVKMKTAMRW